MIEETILKSWGAAELLAELKAREELRRTMVGQLYPSIVFDEECQIIEESRLRFGCHPNWFQERGLLHKEPETGRDLLKKLIQEGTPRTELPTHITITKEEADFLRRVKKTDSRSLTEIIEANSLKDLKEEKK